MESSVNSSGSSAASLLDRNVSVLRLSAEGAFDASAGPIDFDLYAYRGNTLKRTVYVWLEDSAHKRISSQAKFSLPARFTEYNRSGSLKVSGSHSSGAYSIVADGLGVSHSLPVSLSFPASTPAQESEDVAEGESESAVDGSVSFKMLSSPRSVSVNDTFSVRILAANPTEDDLEFDAWSYVYSGSRCVSGGREENRVTLNLPAFSNVTFDLANTALSPGNFTLKAVLLRSDRKTPVELKKSITVMGSSPSSPDSGQENASSNKSISKKSISISHEEITGDAVLEDGIAFRSSSAKGKSLVLYLIMFVLAIISIVLILKKM